MSGDEIMNVLSDDELDEISGGFGETTNYITHKVKRGETLISIGELYGVSWRLIYAANKKKIKDPHWIVTGWLLKIPQGK